MRFIFFIIAVTLHSTLLSQPKNLKEMTSNEISKYYISYLKNGALLVRLQTKSRKIAILRNAGNIAAAEKVKEDQLRTNISIVNAFNNSFTFCPVYFFYSHESKHVMKYELDSIHFLNSKLEYDPSIKPPTQFLTAEFGILKEDTVQNYAGKKHDGSYFYQKDSLGEIKQVKYYSGGTNMSFGALLIKSDQFIQLTRPFPYYMRTLSTIPILRRSHNMVVEMLDEKLFQFYAKHYGK